MIDAVQSVLQDKSVLNGACYIAGCGIGQGIYWVNRWAVGENWVLVNFKRTVAAVTGNLGIMAGFLSLGSVDTLSVGAALFMGVFQGIAADSILNKGSRKIYTDEERAKETR